VFQATEVLRGKALLPPHLPGTIAACGKHLNEIIGIFKFIVDEQGEYSVKVWEWK
jgi:hypothetical protein